MLEKTGETAALRELQHIRHRVSVSADRERCLLTGVEGLLAHVDRHGVIEIRLVALNAVGTLDGTRKLVASQRTGPPTRQTWCCRQQISDWHTPGPQPMRSPARA